MQEIKENYESTLDQGALKNLNADWVNYKGACRSRLDSLPPPSCDFYIRLVDSTPPPAYFIGQGGPHFLRSDIPFHSPSVHL